MTSEILISPIRDIPEIRPGDHLADIIVEAAGLDQIFDHDVFVISQKLVSKAESRVVALADPSPASHEQAVLDEAVRIVRRRGDLIITETRHGFICANSGVDTSNVDSGNAILLPEDPDYSAVRLRDRISGLSKATVAVIISDTFGRPWRRGVTDVAIGCAGIKPIIDLRGNKDAHGNTLNTTEICVADELASAAELVKGKDTGNGAVLIRGVDPTWFGNGSAVADIVRPASEDLFR